MNKDKPKIGPDKEVDELIATIDNVRALVFTGIFFELLTKAKQTILTLQAENRELRNRSS